jgi:hypothetical protein
MAGRSYNSGDTYNCILAMKLPGTENFDEADSVLGRRRTPSPIDILRRRQRPERAGRSGSAWAVRPQFHGRWKHLDSPDLSGSLDWRESLITLAAWLVMLGVVAALIYLVYTVFRYAQPL